MTYREAKKIKVGDIVLTTCGERRRVASVEDNLIDKFVFITFEHGVTYAHTAIKEIEPPYKEHNRYYQILAFNHRNDIDETCGSHIYPSYVSCMSVKGGMTHSFEYEKLTTEPLMLQNNPHDGLKFIDEYNAFKMLDRVKKSYPNKEFFIIEINALFYGRIHPRWVVNL